MRQLTREEEQFIRDAAQYFETPRLVHQLTQVLGKPIEKGVERLPEKAKTLIHQSTQKAIESALKASLATLDQNPVNLSFPDAVRAASETRVAHNAGSAVTGAVGGFFGLPGLAVELPVTTTMMLRSISRIARDFGENLTTREAQLESLYVFSLGSPSPEDDATESAYYTSRIAFSQVVTQAMSFLAGKTAREVAKAVEKEAAPILLKLILKVANRFEIAVGRKALGQLVPGIGAGIGAALNLAFMEHFNVIAKFHFGMRRLERECGADRVKKTYLEASARLSRT